MMAPSTTRRGRERIGHAIDPFFAGNSNPLRTVHLRT